MYTNVAMSSGSYIMGNIFLRIKDYQNFTLNRIFCE